MLDRTPLSIAIDEGLGCYFTIWWRLRDAILDSLFNCCAMIVIWSYFPVVVCIAWHVPRLNVSVMISWIPKWWKWFNSRLMLIQVLIHWLTYLFVFNYQFYVSRGRELMMNIFFIIINKRIHYIIYLEWADEYCHLEIQQPPPKSSILHTLVSPKSRYNPVQKNYDKKHICSRASAEIT